MRDTTLHDTAFFVHKIPKCGQKLEMYCNGETPPNTVELLPHFKTSQVLDLVTIKYWNFETFL